MALMVPDFGIEVLEFILFVGPVTTGEVLGGA
jgi:hypothetical protein